MIKLQSVKCVLRVSTHRSETLWFRWKPTLKELNNSNESNTL